MKRLYRRLLVWPFDSSGSRDALLVVHSFFDRAAGVFDMGIGGAVFFPSVWRYRSL